MSVAAGQLRSFVARIERLHEDKDAISADTKEVYAEAKAAGFDARALRQIVRERAGDPRERRELESIVETYRAALGMVVETEREDRQWPAGDVQRLVDESRPAIEVNIIPHARVAREANETQESPSNRDLSTGDEAWQGGVPQDNRPSVNGDDARETGPAGREGHDEGGGRGILPAAPEESVSQRGGAAAARQAHNLKVAGSSPAPASDDDPDLAGAFGDGLVPP